MNRNEKIEALTRPAVRAMKPYYKAPLEGDPLRLDQNTNLYGANPAISRVAPPAADQYPTRDSDHLLNALANCYGLTPDHFVVGNGSDELLDLLTKTFTAPGQTMATPNPSYSLYPFYAALQELKVVLVPLTSKFGLNVDGLLETDADITIVASPNNPTGNSFPVHELERLIENSRGIVVIDEAYVEYSAHPDGFLKHVDAYDNLVVLRTFSKAHGLAGLRVGYLAANPELAAKLLLVKPPFNLNTYSEAVAVEAIASRQWMEGVVADTITERERLAGKLKQLGLRPHASDANFILCHTDQDPGALAAALQSKGILARTFPGKESLAQCIRFTVGQPEHTDKLVDALEDLV